MNLASPLFLRDLSPFSVVPKNHLLMVLKSFFDGGNEADSTMYDIVTLAGFSGTTVYWTKFDRAWRKVLVKHGAPYLHTTDAVGLTGNFSKRNGWSEVKVEQFISDCVTVIESCAAIRTDRQITKPGIRPASTSVLLKDYKRVLRVIPKLGTASEICATQCVGSCFAYGCHIGADKFELYFDRGEPFYGHIVDRMNNRASRKVDGFFWDSAVHAGLSDMRVSQALQASDVLAWSINHAHQENTIRFEWQERLTLIDRDREWYDYEKLCEPFPGRVETIGSWKLPKRKATR